MVTRSEGREAKKRVLEDWKMGQFKMTVIGKENRFENHSKGYF